MKIHSSYDIKIKSITKDLVQHGIALVDDCGIQTLDQFEDIEEAVLYGLGHAADLMNTEIEEYEAPLFSVFVIRDLDRIDDTEASHLISKSIS